MTWEKHIPQEIQELYVIDERHHAAAILATEFPRECDDIWGALIKFRFSIQDIMFSGGNESNIPKHFSKLLRPKKWVEEKMTAKTVVDDVEILQNTHKVDYIKGRVALDVEWNSKDQTFDRDLYSFRAFFTYGKISLGIIVTRSNELDPWFDTLGSYVNSYGKEGRLRAKYGASTTHMGKLIPRLDAGRHGGCPVLVFGITSKLCKDV